MMLKQINFLGIILLLAMKINAQTLNDPIYFNFSQLQNAKLKLREGNVNSQIFDVNAIFPALKFSKHISLYNSIFYRNTNFTYSQSLVQRNILPKQLHDIRYTATFRIRMNGKWELFVQPRIMLRSDLRQSINGNNFFPQLAIVAIHAVKGNPNFKIGIGGAYSNDFARNAIVPLATLYYNRKKFKIEIYYPNAYFIYKKSKNFEFGLYATAEGAISKITPIIINNQDLDYFKTLQILLAPTATHQIYKNIFGHLKVGFTPIRNFKLLNSDYKADETQNINLKSHLFFRAGVSLRIESD